MLEFLKHSDDKVKKKFKYQLSMLVMENKILREPHVKHFIIERYRQFYEFRIKVSKKIVRIIFCERDDNIVLLHAFYKHDKRVLALLQIPFMPHLIIWNQGKPSNHLISLLNLILYNYILPTVSSKTNFVSNGSNSL